MTEAAFAETMAAPEDGFDAMHPTNVAPLVAWLASEDSGDVTGRVIESEGGKLCVEEGWRHGPSVDIGRRWDAADVGAAVRDLLAQGDPARGRLRHDLTRRTVTSCGASRHLPRCETALHPDTSLRCGRPGSAYAGSWSPPRYASSCAHTAAP